MLKFCMIRKLWWAVKVGTLGEDATETRKELGMKQGTRDKWRDEAQVGQPRCFDICKFCDMKTSTNI